MMRLTVLGCDGSWPGPGGACSGYLLQTETTTIWLDAGTGSFANLQRHINPTELDAVVLSHKHRDHCADFDPFTVYVLNGPGLPKRIPIYAAAEVCEQIFGDERKFEAVFDWEIVNDADQVKVGDIRLTFSRADHGPPTMAVLAQAGGRTFAYSADTGDKWSFAAFDSVGSADSAGSAPASIDLALCEAAYVAEQEGGPFHLTGNQAGLMGKAASVERLMLTHIRPNADRSVVQREAAQAFGRDVELAEQDAIYQI